MPSQKPGKIDSGHESTATEQARVLLAEAQKLMRALATEEGYPVDRPLPANLKMNWQLAMSQQDMLDQARDQIRESMAVAAPMVRGKVFCHHCNNSNCQHATPNGPSEVFADFQSTGRPRFEPLLSYLIELEDDRLEYLTARSPSIVARVVGRRRLLGEQMAEYGRGSLKYAIWGQVVMGYIMLNNEKHALTFQVVETGDRRIRPQIIGSQTLLDAMADGDAPRLVALLAVLRQSSRKIESLGQDAQNQKGKKERAAIREKVFKILRQLALSLERKGRQRGRRTKHAEKRRSEERPVTTGFKDLFRAPVESFYKDEVKGSIVVLGPSGRAHVYSEDGRHVTSLKLKKTEIERRLKRKRYLPLPQEKVTTLLGAVQDRQSRLGSESRASG